MLESELLLSLDWLDNDDQLDHELSDDTLDTLDALHVYNSKSSNTIAESELKDENDDNELDDE